MHFAHKILLGIAISAVAFAQSTSPKPEFEVASVRPVDPGDMSKVQIGLHIDGAQVHLNLLSLKDYIGMAYRLKVYQVNGPDWMASQRYNISAKIPPGTDRDHIIEMLQTLLEDRFKLKYHRDSKEFNVYALVVTKGGLKLKEAVLDEADTPGVNVTAQGSAQGVSLSLGRGSYFTFADNKIEAKKITMVQLADTLARFVDKPVVDMTGTTSPYDVSLNITAEDYRAMLIRSAVNAGVSLPPQALALLDLPSGDSLAAAMAAVGLKLEPRKAPIEVLTVESALKTPTEN